MPGPDRQHRKRKEPVDTEQQPTASSITSSDSTSSLSNAGVLKSGSFTHQHQSQQRNGGGHHSAASRVLVAPVNPIAVPPSAKYPNTAAQLQQSLDASLLGSVSMLLLA